MPKSILIVDDSKMVRGIVRVFLEARGYAVCGEAGDGVEAIEKARALKPDLIVLDFQMPRMNGIEAASALKGMMPNVPIILFTMYSDSLTKSTTEAVHVDLVVPKPEGIGKLAEGVGNLLGAAPVLRPEIRPI
jgi:DNA-binding NarL/FixJ family response regulator